VLCLFFSSFVCAQNLFAWGVVSTDLAFLFWIELLSDLLNGFALCLRKFEEEENEGNDSNASVRPKGNWCANSVNVGQKCDGNDEVCSPVDGGRQSIS
jgi:hypothetical protein